MKQLAHPLLRWHRNLALTTGELALTYCKKKASRAQGLEWIARLELVLKEMREMFE